MKIKETEIKNSNSHAVVYIKPSLFCFLVVEACISSKNVTYVTFRLWNQTNSCMFYVWFLRVTSLISIRHIEI